MDTSQKAASGKPGGQVSEKYWLFPGCSAGQDERKAENEHVEVLATRIRQ